MPLQSLEPQVAHAASSHIPVMGASYLTKPGCLSPAPQRLSSHDYTVWERSVNFRAQPAISATGNDSPLCYRNFLRE